MPLKDMTEGRRALDHQRDQLPIGGIHANASADESHALFNHAAIPAPGVALVSRQARLERIVAEIYALRAKMKSPQQCQ